MMLRALLLSGLFSGLALAAAPAFAQEEDQADEPPSIAREAPIDLLTQLAETLGRAHAVRTLCNGDQDTTWRNYMLNLMAYEAPGGGRRQALTDAFNSGYRSQTRESGSCTQGTPAVEAGIARHGRELSDEIARGYLN